MGRTSISYNGCTDLHVLMNGIVNGQRYRDEILALYVVPYAGAVGQEFILMDDNATAHCARTVNAYIEDQGIHRMYWPSRSPDLSPIEHAWDMLQRRVSARQPKSSERAATLIEEWGMMRSGVGMFTNKH